MTTLLFPPRGNVIGDNEYNVLNLPRCRAYNTTGEASHTGSAALGMTTLDYDNDGMVTLGAAGTARIVCRTQGVYLVVGNVSYGAGAGIRQTFLNRTSTTYGNSQFGYQYNDVPLATAAPVWTAFPFAAGYSDYGGGYQACGYWKDAFGIVHLRGLFHYVTPGSYPNGTPGTLPAGYRPAANEMFGAYASATGGQAEEVFRIDVLSTGPINWTTMSGTGHNWNADYMSLAGITFDSGSLASSAGSLQHNCVDLIRLSAGDYVELFSNTAAAAVINGGATVLNISATLVSTL